MTVAVTDRSEVATGLITFAYLDHIIRPMIDFVIFVEARRATQESRFAAFCRWKGFDADAGRTLATAVARRMASIKQQREGVDMIVSSSAHES
jgi:hypothetical protein